MSRPMRLLTGTLGDEIDVRGKSHQKIHSGHCLSTLGQFVILKGQYGKIGCGFAKIEFLSYIVLTSRRRGKLLPQYNCA